MQLNVAQQSVKIVSLKDEIAKAKEQLQNLDYKLMDASIQKSKIIHATPKPRRQKRASEQQSQRKIAAINRSQSVERLSAIQEQPRLENPPQQHSFVTLPDDRIYDRYGGGQDEDDDEDDNWYKLPEDFAIEEPVMARSPSPIKQQAPLNPIRQTATSQHLLRKNSVSSTRKSSTVDQESKLRMLAKLKDQEKLNRDLRLVQTSSQDHGGAAAIGSTLSLSPK